MNFFAIIRLRKDAAWLTGKVLITLSLRKQGFLIDLPVEIRPVHNLFALAAFAFSACDDARHTSPPPTFGRLARDVMGREHGCGDRGVRRDRLGDRGRCL
jgi:hypothetical protein